MRLDDITWYGRCVRCQDAPAYRHGLCRSCFWIPKLLPAEAFDDYPYEDRVERPDFAPRPVAAYGTKILKADDAPALCHAEDCGEAHWARGLCRRHYNASLWRARRLAQGQPVRGPRPCTFPGCPERCYSRGLCQHHYEAHRSQCRRSGSSVLVLDRPTATVHVEARAA